MPQSVLIIAHAFPPENLVGALRPYRFARYLPEYGFSPSVITATPQSPPLSFPFHCEYVRDPGRQPRGIVSIPIRLERALTDRLQLSGGDQSVWWIPAARRAAERLIQRHHIKFIVSTYPPLVAHLTALRLKARHPHLKWVADFRDPLSGNAASSETVSPAVRFIERQVFRHADYLVANTDTASDRWKALHPELAGKIDHIWNGFDPEERLEAVERPPRDWTEIAHVGEVYGNRDPSPVLASIVRLLSGQRVRPGSVRLHFVGPIDRQLTPNIETLDALVAQGHAVVSPQTSSPAEAARAMASADSLLLIDWAHGKSGFQVPAKLFIYVRVGKPILAITARNSPVDRILARAGIPHVALYPDDTAEVIDDKILRFLAFPPTVHQPSDWFFREFDGRRQVEHLAEILRGIGAPN